jgi:hypothetical protein
MSHVVIIIQQSVAPSSTTTQMVATSGELSAEVTYRPADNLTEAQIGNQVERIVCRLKKLADD